MDTINKRRKALLALPIALALILAACSRDSSSQSTDAADSAAGGDSAASAEVKVDQSSTSTPTPTQEPTSEIKEINFLEIKSTGWTGQLKEDTESLISENLQKLSNLDWVFATCLWSDTVSSVRNEGKTIQLQTLENGNWITVDENSGESGWSKYSKSDNCEQGNEAWEFYDPNFISMAVNLIGECRKYRLVEPETTNYVRTTREWCVAVS